MAQFFGIIFIIYVISAAVFLPAILGTAWVHVRDCELVSGEECVWVVVPNSEAPENQRLTNE